MHVEKCEELGVRGPRGGDRGTLSYAATINFKLRINFKVVIHTIHT